MTAADDAAIRSAAESMTDFTAAELAQSTGLSVWAALRNITMWRSRGDAEKVTEAPDADARWRIVELPGEPKVSGSGAEKEAVMWQAIRGLRSKFTVRDLRIHIPGSRAQLEDEEIRRYVLTLLKARYLRVLTKAVPGTRDASYRLVRDTGPLPPIERRTVIVQDPNLNTITYVAPVKP